MVSRLFEALLLLALSFLYPLARAYSTLSDSTLTNLPSASSDFDIHTGSILAPILIPRVPGTPGIAVVQKHFVSWFRTHLPKWNIEFQNSSATTPASAGKQVPFVNIIITRDPPWTKPGDVGRLALVAHYDSKLTPAGFIGATDSAVPCAVIMHSARSVDEALTRKWAAMEADGSAGDGLNEEKGVQILLLDGEEAFISWTDKDSLYGARSLAEEWEATAHAALSTYRTHINSISLFLLLDLLGTEKPNVPSYFQTTHWAYQHLAKVELRLRSLGQLQSKPDHPFLPETNKVNFNALYGVQDDHIPFMKRGVDILHIIPTPFPPVWHNMDDDGAHLDLPTVEDWARIVTGFVGEWMELEGHFPSKAQAHVKEKEKKKTEL